MSGPRRLIRSEGLGAKLLASAKADGAPSESRQRALAAAAAATAAAAGAKAAAAAGFSLGRWASAKWVVIGVAGVLAIVGVRETRRVAQPASPAPVAVPEAVAPVPRVPAEQAEPVAAPMPMAVQSGSQTVAVVEAKPPRGPERSKPRAVSAPSVASAEPATPDTLAQEIAQIDRAKAALVVGDTAMAFRVLDDYARGFPRGLLAQEATALRIQALARSGRRAEARASLASFRAGFPASPLLENLERIVDE